MRLYNLDNLLAVVKL